jgi:shikimate dehydrogenase
MNVYGLIGYPLTHSFSKKFFSEKFKRQNIANCLYENFELSSVDELPSLLLNEKNLRGLNVTIPYKKSVIPFLDELDETAAAIGAVNCIDLRFGKKTGFNTDAYGFAQSVADQMNQHQQALIFGTGGSSAAIQYALRKTGKYFKLVSRNKSENTITYSELTEEVVSSHTFLINCTPVGMFPHVNETLPIPFQFIGSNHFVVDLVYNPEKTLLLQRCETQGAICRNGFSMLQWQAEKSWEIWNR